MLGGRNAELTVCRESLEFPETKTQPPLLMNVRPLTVVVCTSPEPPELLSASSGGGGLRDSHDCDLPEDEIERCP